MRFWKYHGLGNDYLVVDAPRGLETAAIRTICHRNYGVGADGILLRQPAPPHADFAVRIFNPDGSEAEKSGNGLRIFARYLFDEGLADDQPFTIDTLGGVVGATVDAASGSIALSMGRARWVSRDLAIAVDDRTFVAQQVDMGNPHCVIFLPQISAEFTNLYGPLIETNPIFPNRSNVQFAQVIDRQTVAIEIWERGAGYTLASGSSSCAAAAAAHWLGHTERDMQVQMPGGVLSVSIDDDDQVTLIGPVVRVMDGEISAETIKPQ